MKKAICVLLILIALKSYAQPQGFTLEISLDKNFPGYVYLYYEDKVDSSLVVNKQLRFKGFLDKGVSVGGLNKRNAYFTIDKKLYLENTDISIVANVATKKWNENDTLTILEVQSISGSRTIDLNESVNEFIKMHERDSDFHEKLYHKVDAIVTANPQNPIASDLVFELMRQKYDNAAIEKLYRKIDKEKQELFSMRKIENKLFPKDFVETNDPIFNFTLPDRNGKPFDTQTLQGQWILIDFWASWCTPCREQIPGLKRIYDLYRAKNFEIVAVSVDQKKNEWIAALDKEQPQWINVIEHQYLSGPIATKYNLYGVPHNYLVDANGKIIAKDVTLELLEKILIEML